MYFESFPYTLYTVDNNASAQLIKNILLRVTLNENVRNNYSYYDEYDVKDGETPEIVSFKAYQNSMFHWLILHFNEILDPRFSWPLSVNNLNEYVKAKYESPDNTHHYEDNNGNEINGNIYIQSSSLTNFNVGSIILNRSGNGIGVITEKLNSSNVRVLVSEGGFVTGNQIQLQSNTSITANITATVTIEGTAVTNFVHEDKLNEMRRRVKILKPRYVESVVREFTDKIESVNEF